MSNMTLFQPGTLPAHIAALQNSAVDDNDEFAGSGIARLVALSIRGKEFRFRTNGQENATGLREMECIIVRRREKTSRRFYGSKYTSGTVESPTCHSIDGITPDRGLEIQAKTCSECPHSVWGSKVNEAGQQGFACDSYKMLALVPMLGSNLAEQAVALNLPATSIKRSKNAVGTHMHAKEYFEALKKHGLPAIGAVTRLKFTSAEYPQIAFEFVRHATEAELAHAMALRDSDEVVGAVEGTLVEETGTITETPKPVLTAPVVAEPVKLADLPKVVEEAKPKRVQRVTAQAKAVEEDDTVVAEVVQAKSSAGAEDPNKAMDAVRRLLAGLNSQPKQE